MDNIGEILKNTRLDKGLSLAGRRSYQYPKNLSSGY